MSVRADSGPPAVIESTGCALRMDAAQIVAADTMLARLVMEIGAASAAGQTVALRINGIDDDSALQTLETCLDRLAEALDRSGIRRNSIELTMAAMWSEPRSVHELCIAAFGARRLNLCVDDRRLPDERGWEALRDVATSGRVLIGCWPFVSSRSALLSAEIANDVLPGHGLQAPAQSAWLKADLEFATAYETGNSLSREAIQQILAPVFDAADALYETQLWPTPSMGHDAWFNRRMSIRLVGIGDWVRDQGLDAESHDTLAYLDGIVRAIAHTFEQASRSRSSEPLPAVLAADPGRLMGTGAQRDAWSERWREAVARCGMRHRNLLTMSPWAIFPAGNADYRYANLLPLLRHGDACSFAREVAIKAWNTNEFRDFHLRILRLRSSLPEGEGTS